MIVDYYIVRKCGPPNESRTATVVAKRDRSFQNCLFFVLLILPQRTLLSLASRHTPLHGRCAGGAPQCQSAALKRLVHDDYFEGSTSGGRSQLVSVARLVGSLAGCVRQQRQPMRGESFEIDQ